MSKVMNGGVPTRYILRWKGGQKDVITLGGALGAGIALAKKGEVGVELHERLDRTEQQDGTWTWSEIAKVQDITADTQPYKAAPAQPGTRPNKGTQPRQPGSLVRATRSRGKPQRRGQFNLGDTTAIFIPDPVIPAGVSVHSDPAIQEFLRQPRPQPRPDFKVWHDAVIEEQVAKRKAKAARDRKILTDAGMVA